MVTRRMLSKSEIQELVQKNKYLLPKKSLHISRCIDGRYENREDLPALAIPGADAGELGIILATATAYGLEVDQEKVFEALVEVVGGIKNIQFHTSDHSNIDVPAAGDGHMKQLTNDPDLYSLSKDQIKFIQEKLEFAKRHGAKEAVLHGEHEEGAVLYVRGNYGVMPQCDLEVSGNVQTVQTYIYQGTFVDARHRILAKKLLEKKAITLLDGLDEEYFYQILGDMTDTHLLETVKRLAKDLPFYGISFKEDGDFTIEDMGIIE